MGVETVDQLLQRDGSLRRLDGRVKTALAFGGTLVAVIIAHPLPEVLLLGIALGLLRYGRLPLQPYRVRLLIPFGIAWLVLLNQAVLQGTTVLWHLPPPLAMLSIHREGLRLGLLLSLRILAAVSLVTLLSFTTPLNEILASLRYLGIPPFVLDVALMTYRYIFVLGDELSRMRLARASRSGGEGGRWRAAAGLGQLAGMVFLRAAERGLRVYRAMLARGYDEDSHLADYFQGRTLTAGSRWQMALGGCLLLAILVWDHSATFFWPTI